MTFSTSPCLFTGRLNYVSPRFTLPQPKDQNTRTRYVRHIILEHVNRPDERLSAYLLGDMAEYFPFSVGDILEANLRFNLLIGEHASHTQIFASLRGIVVEWGIRVFSITPMNYSMPDAGDDAQCPVPELSDWSALGNDVHILTQSLGGGRQDARGATSSEVDSLPPSLGLTFMTKHELALMYFPTKTYGAALQALRRVFLRNPTLMARLERKGYKKTHQFLSPAQLALVFDELGRP